MKAIILFLFLLLLLAGGWLVGGRVGEQTALLLIGLALGMVLSMPLSLAIANWVGRERGSRERHAQGQEKTFRLLGEE